MLRRFVAAAVIVLGMVTTRGPARAECPRSPAVVALVERADRTLTIDLDGAIADYEAASKLAPNDPRVLWKLARAYQKKQAWDRIVPVLDRACALDPHQAEYALLRGHALSRLAEKGAATWAAARASLETAAALDPAWDEPEIDLAEALLHLNDDAGAIAHLMKAIRNQPDRASTYANLGDLYLRLGYLDHAEKVLRAGLTVDTDGKQAFTLRALLGYLMDRRNDPARALVELEAAKAACGACNEPGQAVVFFQLGAAYAATKPARKNEARDALSQFQRIVCRGAAAARRADECMQAQQLLVKLGSP
jgi:tetratricopeptide (TPR) repeat protein